MTHYIFDDHHHLTAFSMLFPDGEIKPAFLLTSLMDFTDREINSRHLNRYGLRRGIDYFVATTRSLQSDMLGEHFTSKNHGSRRIILSLSGVLMLITQSRTDFGDQLFYWIYDEVVPSVMMGEAVSANHPMLQELRAVISRMSDDIAQLQNQKGFEGYSDRITLEDLIGTSIQTIEDEERNTNG